VIWLNAYNSELSRYKSYITLDMDWYRHKVIRLLTNYILYAGIDYQTAAGLCKELHTLPRGL
jgi:hypothetical protein